MSPEYNTLSHFNWTRFGGAGQQGKIERYHRSIKNVINLQNYYLPGELKLEIERFVEYYNNRRYHESLDNLTPATVYNGCRRQHLSMRDIVKRKTLKARKAFNLGKGERKNQLLLLRNVS